MKENQNTSSPLLNEIKKIEDEFIHTIHKRLGIVIHKYQISDLQKTITKACNKFNVTPTAYLNSIISAADNTPEIEHLIAGITIGETYFFRDKPQMNLIYNVLLPKIIEKKSSNGEYVLRIWSAGSSTGEEIYTIAMMLNELIPNLKKWTIQLLATDLNTFSLKKAMKAEYSSWSMRVINDYYKNKYFTTTTENHYQLSPDIREMVRFEYLNLKSDNFPAIFNGTQAQDLILCCNVLIYFNLKNAQELMKKFANCLVDDGYLILGVSDPIMLHDTPLVFHNEQGVYITKSTEKKPDQAVLPPPDMSILEDLSVKIKKVTATVTPKIQENISLKTDKTSIDMVEINNLMHNSQWQEVLALINHYDLKEHPSVFLLNAKTTVLANLGKLEEANATSKIALQMDPANKQTYFIYALVLLGQNQFLEAEEALRKSIFLDHQFVEAHFQLGLLLIRNKKTDTGIKSLKNALRIAKSKNPNEAVSEMHGLNFKQLTDILAHEIEMYTIST